MNIRHTDNNHLRLHYEPFWNGLPVQIQHGPLIANYLESIFRTMHRSLAEFNRTVVVRLDIRFPQGWTGLDTSVISDFLEELQWQLDYAERMQSRHGKRIYPNTLRYSWVKEQVDSDQWHYHLALMLNRDAYFTLGMFPSRQEVERSPVIRGRHVGNNLASRCMYAFAAALKTHPINVFGCVHFPNNAIYSIDSNSQYFSGQFEAAFWRLSYLAKVHSKHYGDHSWNFSCSRK